ncbi:MAG TPA: hypothetical protein PLX49_02280 [Prolixibacteraceae bacterium]|nr:hypothetical protein [Prolixibacteraceae bacterium]
MVRTRIPYLPAVCLCLLVACRPPWSNDRVAVAKAGDDILYLDELQSIIPDGIGSGDSLLMAEDYIRKWVTASLLVTKAEENLTMAQRDVTAELKEYRAGLITYRYKKALMAEKLDTVVSDQEITAFYEKNKPHFTLTAPLMKAVFIKIPLEVSQPEKARAFCGSSNPVELRELQEFCLRYAESYQLYTDRWVDAGLVLRNLPGYDSPREDRITSGSTLEERDDKYYYLICVLGFKEKGESAPPEYVSGNIRDLIINTRKTEFLKKLEEDIYAEGVRNKKFRLYEMEKK